MRIFFIEKRRTVNVRYLKLTAKNHLKMDAWNWNASFLLGYGSLFSGAISGSVGTYAYW